MKSGDRIVIVTPDRRQFRGRLIEVKEGDGGRSLAVVRLDTGWVTTYPLEMVHPEAGTGPTGDS